MKNIFCVAWIVLMATLATAYPTFAQYVQTFHKVYPEQDQYN